MKIFAPFAGIVHYFVTEGELVSTGEKLATVEALKLEAPILAPGPGVVKHIFLADFADVIGGEELMEVVDHN